METDKEFDAVEAMLELALKSGHNVTMFVDGLKFTACVTNRHTELVSADIVIQDTGIRGLRAETMLRAALDK